MRDEKRNIILGLSAFYHDSAAALVIDGRVVAAAEEERFTRRKHDKSFPTNAISYVLGEYNLKPSQLDAVVFYEKPLLTFERLLEIHHRYVPRGVAGFIASMTVWLRNKLFTRQIIKRELEHLEGRSLQKKMPILLFSEHHISHAASAFYPSPFNDSAILTIDGVGEWTTTLIAEGRGKELRTIKDMHFPHSLGLLYSAFTYYCGFSINDGEYKLMGLASYGHQGSPRVAAYKEKILSELVDVKEDGSFFTNMSYFLYATELRTTDDSRWKELFAISPRVSGAEITQEYMDLALAIQEVTEEIVVKLVRTAQKLTDSRNLVLAGGVALNCVANKKILEAKIFDQVWIQPAAGDSGGALGAALACYHIYFDKERVPANDDCMRGSYLGPEYSEKDTERMIESCGAVAQLRAESELYREVAHLIASGTVVGWFQGRMEWGPRALGNRSIIADPRNAEMQQKLNSKIKFREEFRPFAPSILEEDVEEYFEMTYPSPYMLFTAEVTQNRRLDIPAVTHRDYSARPQTVSQKTNKRFWNLINAFKEETGYGLIINTSFNVRDEPLVMTPEDAYRCFMNTGMDYLIIGNYIFDKKVQPAWSRDPRVQTYEFD